MQKTNTAVKQTSSPNNADICKTHPNKNASSLFFWVALILMISPGTFATRWVVRPTLSDQDTMSSMPCPFALCRQGGEVPLVRGRTAVSTLRLLRERHLIELLNQDWIIIMLVLFFLYLLFSKSLPSILFHCIWQPFRIAWFKKQHAVCCANTNGVLSLNKHGFRSSVVRLTVYFRWAASGSEVRRILHRDRAELHGFWLLEFQAQEQV